MPLQVLLGPCPLSFLYPGCHEGTWNLPLCACDVSPQAQSKVIMDGNHDPKPSLFLRNCYLQHSIWKLANTKALSFEGKVKQNLDVDGNTFHGTPTFWFCERGSWEMMRNHCWHCKTQNIQNKTFKRCRSWRCSQDPGMATPLFPSTQKTTLSTVRADAFCALLILIALFLIIF